MYQNCTLFIAFIFALVTSCNLSQPQQTKIQTKADLFLNEYNQTFQKLLIEAAEAEWTLNTRIIEGDTVTDKLAQQAQEKMALFNGSEFNIKTAQEFLKQKDFLTETQVRQLESIIYAAASSPAIVIDKVKGNIKLGTAQTQKLFGFKYVLDGQELSTNQIDSILRTSKKLDEREKVWASSKEVGKSLKQGVIDQKALRNQIVQSLDYKNYFEFQVSDYGMNAQQMLEMNKKLINDIWPLYRELHTWARYHLAQQYNQPVPDMIPAHWLPNRWGQDWTGLVEVEGLDLDEVLKEKSAEWIVRQAEDFYVSIGFEALPQSFYEKSSLYPLPKEANYKKNNHASAWHMDNDQDVRSLMSVEPNTEWWETTLHELGHIYYYLTYSNEDVPIILRGGANRAYHEAMGSLLGLASLQKPFLQSYGLISENLQLNDTLILLKEAMNYVVLIPWASGVMTHYEHDLYSDGITNDQLNSKWWYYKELYQGITPPEKRSEAYCDAASKTHIVNDPAQYYDYALSYVLLFQFHEHIANNILKQDVHQTNYYGNTQVGDFLKALMYDGANVDWPNHLKEHLGSQISAKPMLDYFEPLMHYLKKVNKGRVYTLTEQL